MKTLLSFTALFLLLSLINCKKSDSATTNIQVSKLLGYVQKGPYINGTSITLYKLNSNLEQLGTSYSSQILDNKGTFQLANLSFPSKYVLFYANGFYYNEVSGTVSLAPLQLYGLADITNATTVNINVMTHLERRRVEYLMKQGKSFTEAKKTAQQDILNIFGFQTTTIKESEKLDINVQGDDNAILLAISLILQGNLSVGDFSELLSIISADLEQDGKLDNAGSLDKLKSNVFALNVATIRKNLETRYQSLGLTASIPNFEKYIQQYLSTFPIDITSGLVAYYPFNGNANDESGNGNNGTVFGATLTEDRYGNSKNCFNFNQQPSYIRTNNIVKCDANNFTISVWVNPHKKDDIKIEGITGSESYASMSVIHPTHGESYGNITSQNAGVGLNVGLNQIQVVEHTANYISSPLVYPCNITGWSHIILIYENHTPKLYLNSVLVRTGLTSLITNIYPSNGYCNFYTQSGFGNSYLPNGTPFGQFIGEIDDIRIYNRVLTQEQISYLATH